MRRIIGTHMLALMMSLAFGCSDDSGTPGSDAGTKDGAVKDGIVQGRDTGQVDRGPRPEGGYPDTVQFVDAPQAVPGWARSAGGVGSEEAFDLVADGSGNSYVVGAFSQSAKFGAIELTGDGDTNAFVAKLDDAGKFVWATALPGGVGEDAVAYRVAVDDAGNVYATGEISGSTTWGQNTLTAAGSYDAFVVKLSASGAIGWAFTMGGASYDGGQGIAVGAGTVYVIGEYESVANFGEQGAKTSLGGTDIFVAAANATSGALTALTSIGGTQDDCPDGFCDIAAGPGGAYLVGYFTGTLAGTYTSAGSTDVVVAKVDTAGAVQWMATGGGPKTDYGQAIAVDAQGNVVVTGSFKGETATFGAVTLAGNAGGTNPMVVKFGPTGSVLWGTAGNTAGTSEGYGIALDASGNSYVMANLRNELTMGGKTITPHGSYDALVIKLDPTGTVKWLLRGGGAGLDEGAGVGVDGNGDLRLGGTFSSSSASFGAHSLTTAGGSDAFIWKLEQ